MKPIFCCYQIDHQLVSGSVDTSNAYLRSIIRNFKEYAKLGSQRSGVTVILTLIHSKAFVAVNVICFKQNKIDSIIVLKFLINANKM